MSKKIKVGNAEIEKANYDYFLSQYSKMPKEYVIADLVSKCEQYGRLYNSYEKLEVEKIQKENIIKEVKDYIRNNMIMYDNIEAEVEDILILLDKGE